MNVKSLVALAVVLCSLVTVQANEKPYLFFGVPHWYSFENEIESIFDGNFEGSQTGYTVGVGLSAINKWSIETLFGESPNINVGLPVQTESIYRYVKLKPRFASFAIERQFPMFDDTTYLVSKIGFTHYRIKVEGVDTRAIGRKHDLETNLDLFVGVRKSLASLQSDITFGFNFSANSDLFERSFRLNYRIFLKRE